MGEARKMTALTSLQYTLLLCLVGHSFSGIYACNVHFAVLTGSVQLECPVDSSRQLFNTEWSYNQRIIVDQFGNQHDSKFTSVVRETNSHRVSMLSFGNTSFADGGLYHCEMFYDSGANDKDEFCLNVQGYPQLATQANSTEGDNIIAECCIDVSLDSTERRVKWFIDDWQVPDVTGGFASQITNISERYCDRLQMQSHRQYNNQTLTCLVANRLNLNDSTILEVLYPVNVDIAFEDSAARIASSFNEHSGVHITCTTQGNPQPTEVILERYDGQPIYSWSDRSTTSTGSLKWTFRISNVSRNDRGCYKCNTTNGYGATVISEGFLDINFEPMVGMLSPSVIKVVEGNGFTIECRTNSNPRSDVYLQKEIHTITWISLPSEPISINENEFDVTSEFTLLNTTKDYEGFYRCHANNGIGTDVSLPTWVNIEEALEDTPTTTVSSILASPDVMYLSVTSITVIGCVIMLCCLIVICCSAEILGEYHTETPDVFIGITCMQTQLLQAILLVMAVTLLTIPHSSMQR